MKLLKHVILLALALCNFMWSANIFLVQAIDENEINAVSVANQVENYELKRVLKSQKVSATEKDNYVLHYEHKKTGAQFVCFINLDNDNLQIAYRVPSENDNGVTHALEHCVCDDIVSQPEDNVVGDFEAYTHEWGFLITARYENDRFENIDFLINSLKSKKFLNNENIFKKQVFNQTKNSDGSILKRGRMFIEMASGVGSLSVMSAYVDKIYNHEIINRDNKLKFQPGGMPENIANCSYSDVCDAYNKYIHPSNSLTVIRSKHFKKIMAKLDKDFLNGYDRKNIDVDYRLPNKSNFESFSEYDVDRTNGIFSENYDYCAVAVYPLMGVKNDKIKTFDNLCSTINDPLFEYDIFEDEAFDVTEKYDDCKAELCQSVDCPYLKIAIASNDPKKFDRSVLVKNFNHILAIANMLCSPTTKYGITNVSCEHLMRAYAFSGDIFGDRFFTIENNEIIDCEDNSGIDESLLQDLKPEKIAFLKCKKNISKNVGCRYQVSFADNDKEMTRLAMRILNRGLVSKELQKKGFVYKNLYTRSEANDERCCCFYSDQSVAFDNITHFFKNNFNEQVKNFVVSDELFNLVKNNIINKKCKLDAVCPPEYYGAEEVIKKEIVDKPYSSSKPETKKNISEISKEEIQNFIRTAKFVGYAVVE